jgi:hypothetical protein
MLKCLCSTCVADLKLKKFILLMIGITKILIKYEFLLFRPFKRSKEWMTVSIAHGAGEGRKEKQNRKK